MGFHIKKIKYKNHYFPVVIFRQTSLQVSSPRPFDFFLSQYEIRLRFAAKTFAKAIF
jgi:hypothetical protein